MLLAAASHNARLTVLLLTLQVVIMPQSAAISAMLLVALTPPIFLGHYFAALSVRRLLVLVNAPLMELEVTNTAIAVFFLWDHALCLYSLHRNPQGAVMPKGLAWHAKHWAFSLLNTKAYQAVLLLLMRGSTVSLTCWLVASLLPLGPMIGALASHVGLDWGCLFYHQHRLAHLPVVYQDAHKLHHYLHDASPFDAHL